MCHSWLPHQGKHNYASYPVGTLTQPLDNWWLCAHIRTDISLFNCKHPHFGGSGWCEFHRATYGIRKLIICWGDMLKYFIQEVCCLTSWIVMKSWIFHLNSDIITWFCHLGILQTNAKLVMLFVCVQEITNISGLFLFLNISVKFSVNKTKVLNILNLYYISCIKCL